MANKPNKDDLFQSVMGQVDDRIHITRSTDRSTGKVIIREEDSSSSSPSQLSNVAFPSSGRYEYVENSSGQRIKMRKSKGKEEEISPIPEKVASPHFMLQVSDDYLTAHLMVQKPKEGTYSKTEILDYLTANGIISGIDEDMLAEIVKGKHYYEEVIIAKGTSPIDGKDGYYEYHFNTRPETKPIILKDGSVDYNTLGKFELVLKDQLLATYHVSRPHRDGIDVYGRLLKAAEGKELPKLAGKGFDFESDNNEYYSNMEGKINFEKGELSIVPVFIVDNLEATTGDLLFHGDVVVKGNVFSNVTVKTTGNITVNGHVEVATLIAGKDVLLKNGMQGAGTGRIFAKGKVMAKFLEQTFVQASGPVSANAILNCTVFSDDSVIVSGTRGSILGGSVTAVKEIQASTIGNRIGMDTKLVIGLEDNYKISMEKIDAEIEACQKQYRDIDSRSSDPRETAQIKAELSQKAERLASRKERMSDIRERSANGKIVVTGMVYSGSHIIMNGMSEVLTSERKNVTFTRSQREIRVLSNTLS